MQTLSSGDWAVLAGPGVLESNVQLKVNVHNCINRVTTGNQSVVEVLFKASILVVSDVQSQSGCFIVEVHLCMMLPLNISGLLIKQIMRLYFVLDTFCFSRFVFSYFHLPTGIVKEEWVSVVYLHPYSIYHLDIADDHQAKGRNWNNIANKDTTNLSKGELSALPVP